MAGSHTSARVTAFPVVKTTVAPSWPLVGRATPTSQLIVRLFIGGAGRIAGTVAIKGTPNQPVRRRVRLFRERDGLCFGEVRSDEVTGAFEFVGVDPAEKYTVIAYDGPRVFRASIQDGVTPVPL